MPVSWGGGVDGFLRLFRIERWPPAASAAPALQRSSVSNSSASRRRLRSSLNHASVHTRCWGGQSIGEHSCCGHRPASYALRMALTPRGLCLGFAACRARVVGSSIAAAEPVAGCTLRMVGDTSRRPHLAPGYYVHTREARGREKGGGCRI